MLGSTISSPIPATYFHQFSRKHLFTSVIVRKENSRIHYQFFAKYVQNLINQNVPIRDFVTDSIHISNKLEITRPYLFE